MFVKTVGAGEFVHPSGGCGLRLIGVEQQRLTNSTGPFWVKLHARDLVLLQPLCGQPGRDPLVRPLETVKAEHQPELHVGHDGAPDEAVLVEDKDAGRYVLDDVAPRVALSVCRGQVLPGRPPLPHIAVLLRRGVKQEVVEEQELAAKIGAQHPAQHLRLREQGTPGNVLQPQERLLLVIKDLLYVIDGVVVVLIGRVREDVR